MAIETNMTREFDTRRFDALAGLVRQRRTSKLVDPHCGVTEDVLRSLCDLAQWAPNHKRTWPWRFAAFVGDGRARLGAALITDMAATSGKQSSNSATDDYRDNNKRAALLTKYLRTPAVLVIGSTAGANPLADVENRDAVAAGIQNVLLGATALGLAASWGSPPFAVAPATTQLCGFEPDVRLVTMLSLGWAAASPDVPARPPVRLTIVEA